MYPLRIGRIRKNIKVDLSPGSISWEKDMQSEHKDENKILETWLQKVLLKVLALF
jgi:hypothetical protein